jgi:dienelactone hydrolase
MSLKTCWGVWCLALCLLSQSAVHAADEAPQYLALMRAAAQRDLAGGGTPITDADAASRRLAEVRKHLLEAWGGFPTTPCDLAPRVLETLDRDGYKLEKLLLQTFPDVWMTAHAYVPKQEGKLPAVLCVHGHWKEAKQAPAVQARCIGLAKHGYFVLAVDAFGAGERGVGEALGEYHGEMTATTLLPVGKPLSGIQVYENMRAVDYLQSRPEVNPHKIGITGASGGGNQTMYAGAWDSRFKAVIPVCSVGTYNSYLGTACCMCEVVPGAARFSCEGEVLGLVAPRGLMLFNATKDSNQFSVKEARKSLAVAQTYFDFAGAPAGVQQTVFDWHHDYSPTMRERMYGWMALHLKGEGDGSPLPDPAMTLEDPEAIRCYPGSARPDDWLTLPQFAAREARQILGRIDSPQEGPACQVALSTMKDNLLRSNVYRNNPRIEESSPGFQVTDQAAGLMSYVSEPGITLPAKFQKSPAADNAGARLVVIANLDIENAEQVEKLSQACQAGGWNVLIPQLRATGTLSPTGDKIANAPDHNSAQWGLWVDRPLLGQWCHDLQRALTAMNSTEDAFDAAMPGEIALIGVGTAGPVVLSAAAVDSRFTRVATVNSLVSYVSPVPFRGQRAGLMAPGILRDVGDIPHIAALIQPRPLTIAGGVTGGGQTVDDAELRSSFSWTAKAYELTGYAMAFVTRSDLDVAAFLK